MLSTKAHIIAQLQKDILPLQGYKPVANAAPFDAGLGAIKYAFPNSVFPLGAVHEFVCAGAEDVSATSGFIAGIVASLMKGNGSSLWLSPGKMIFPPALKAFGIQPDKVIFMDIAKEKERLWVMEEAMKCEALSAVIGDIQEVSFNASRRFQLAVEQSRVTGFLVRNNPRNMATASVARWQVKQLATTGSLPGVGFPRWNIELLKVRNGKPGNWQLEWVNGRFRHVYKLASLEKVEQRKAG